MKKINTYQRRMTAALLALVMIITSLPIDLLAYATDPEPDYGIGVYNNAYTSNDTDYCNYQIRFYYGNSATPVTTVPEFSITDSGGETVYTASDGTFELKKGRKIDFTSNSDFRNFVNTKLNDQRISKIEILYRDDITSNENSYELYSIGNSGSTNSTADETNKKITYNLVLQEEKKDEEGHTVYVIDPETGEPTNEPEMVEKFVGNGSAETNKDKTYTLSTFTLSVKEEHNVIINWHDTGAGRPDDSNNNYLDIQLQRKIGEGTTENYTGDLKVNHTTSNIYTYTYTVPKYNENGQEYTYSAKLGADFSCTDTITGLDYRVEHNDGNSFDLYGQRTFDCNIKWMQGNGDNEPKTQEEIAKYIVENFNLIDQTNGNTEITLTKEVNGETVPDTDRFTYKKVYVDADGNEYSNQNEGSTLTPIYKLSISGLDAVTSDGRGKTYYLEKIDPNANIPVGGESTDSWNAIADNPGVHSSVTDKVYQNATLNNVITGTTDFTVNVDWKDKEHEEQRLGLQNPGEVHLWRYANDGTADASDKSAQAASSPLVQTENYKATIYKDSEGNIVDQNTPGAIAVAVNEVAGDGTAGDPILDANDKPTYVEQITFKDLPKYDRFGNLYVYSAKEQLNTSNEILKEYEAQYTLQNGTQGASADNGGTITNKLAGKRNFTVEAEWKAAARQGGEASVTYQLQKKTKNEQGEEVWVPVDDIPLVDADGNMLKLKTDENGNTVNDENGKPVYEITENINEAVKTDGSITITDFKAETMKKTGKFGPVDEFDENGNKIVYRVVQTNITRDDGLETPGTYDQPTYESTTQPITINGDKYNIEVSPSPDNNSTDDYKFLYQLTGDIKLTIDKLWDDSKNSTKPVTHEKDTVKARVERMNFGENEFQTYSDNSEADPTTQCVLLKKENEKSYDDDAYTRTWEREIWVPIYDEDGHQYQYRVKELETFERYVMWVTYDKPTNTYTIQNTYTPPGGPSLDFSKTWNDDGDLLHRKSVTINYTANVGRASGGHYNEQTQQYDSTGEVGAAGSIEVEEKNSWRARIGRLSSYTYNSDDFTETDGSDSNTYVKLANISDVPANTSQEYKWIYDVLTKNYNNVGTQRRNMADKQVIAFTNNLTGIYINDNHYYAVEQVDKGGEIEFINTRIGVVSYEIEFDWRLGAWANASNTNTVEVKLTPYVNGQPLKTVKDTNNEDIPYSITESINIKDVPIRGNTFYLTNLPKYNNEGKIIEWKIEEMKIAGETIEEKTINGQKVRCCTITDNGEEKTCVVTASEPVYTYGTDRHNDDLIKVKLTNKFVDTAEATVHKIWYDDNNALGLRSDTYIQLWGRKKGTNDSFEKYGNDYVFRANDNNEWSYTFTGIDKFDPDGYEYEYAIKELEMSDYATGFYKSHSSITDQSETVPSELSDRMVPSGGTFTDRISGVVYIEGDKLWKDISSDLEKKHYPIAQINLQRQDKYRKDQNGKYVFVQATEDNGTPIVDEGGNPVYVYDDDSNGNRIYKKELSTEADKIKIGQTMIYSGQNKYAFKADSQWTEDNTTYSHEVKNGYYVVDSGTSPKTKGTNKVIALPKFDEDGALITYSLSEEAINGYTFKISNDKITNEYNGGRPLEIKVTKNWENMNASSIFPNVKLILHQVMFAQTTNAQGQILQNDGSYVPAAQSKAPKITPVEYATYEKLLRKDEESTHHWTYTFGENIIDGSNVYIPGDKFIKEEGSTSTTKSATVKFSNLPDGTYNAVRGDDDRTIVAINQTTSPNNTVSVQFTLNMPKTSMADKHVKLQRKDGSEWTDVIKENSNKNIQAYINNSTSFENVVEGDELVIKNNSFVVSGDQKQATVKLTNLTSGEYRIVVTGDSGSAVASGCTYNDSNVTFTVERPSADSGDQYVTLQRLDNNNNKWEAVTKDKNNSDIQVSFNSGSAESALNGSAILIPEGKFSSDGGTNKERATVKITGLEEGSYRAVLGKNVYTQELDETAENTVEVNVTVKIPADNGDEQYIKLKCDGKDVIYDQNKEKIKASFNNDPNAVEVLEVLSSRKNSKEDIRQYAPDGSYFGYYVTEVLSNYEGESIELNAMDVSNVSQFLGDFYKAAEIHTAITTVNTGNMYTKYNKGFEVRDDGYGFRMTKLEQPAQLSDGNTEEQYSELRSQEPILRDAEITNTYEPDIDKFYGNLVVNKTWDDKDDSTNGQNALNTADFNKNAHDYTFTVSRKTSRLPLKSLFKINTWDITVDPPRPTVGVLDESGDFIINLDNPMKKYDSNDRPIADGDTTEVSYYAKTIDFTKYVYTNLTNEIKVTVKVYKTPGENYNKVEISGLAIYGQDAVKYTYYITETGTVSAQENGTDTGDNEAYTFKQPLGQKMDGADNNAKAEFGLANELKVFTLNLNKVFGKRFTKQDGSSNNETATEVIGSLQSGEYRVISDEDNVVISDLAYDDSANSVTFKVTRPENITANTAVTLQRKNGDSWENVEDSSPRVLANASFSKSDESTDVLSTEDYEQYFNDDYVNNLRFILERRKSNETEYTRYDYTDTAISDHVYDDDGHKQYSVIKGTDSNNLPYYRLQFKNLPKYSADGYVYYYRVTELEPSDTSNKHYTTTYTTTYSQYGGSTPVAVYCDSDTDESRDTYVRNNFESKQITVNKYWNDEKNADGLRPDNLKVTIKESIGETNPTTVNINKVLTDKKRWTMLVELPKYYYNGSSPTDNLKYGIDETMQVTTATDKVSAYDLTANGYSLEENGYESKSDDNLTKHKFTNTTALKNIEDSDFYSLYLQNKQDKRVNSKLTFDKAWEDMQNKWSLRPDTVYIKVLRKSKAPIPPDSAGIIKIAANAAVDGKITAVINGLPEKDENNSVYFYQVVEGIDKTEQDSQGNNTITTEWKTDTITLDQKTTTENNKSVKRITFTKTGVTGTGNLKFKLQRKIDGGEFTDVTEDAYNRTIQVFAGDDPTNEVVTKDNAGKTIIAKDIMTTFDVINGVIAVPKAKAFDGKVSLIIENLPKANGENEYTYQALNGTNVLSSETRSTGTSTVSVLVKDVAVGESGINVKLQRKAGEGDFADVTGDVTQSNVRRYFEADSNGVVALPASVTGNKTSDNPKVVFENLAYGVNSSGEEQDNGNWNPYYYTTVECDKYGNDFATDWECTSNEVKVNVPPKEKSSQKIDFSIKLDGFSEHKTYLNIRVARDNDISANTDITSNEIATKDINGQPIKITIGTEEYYASSSTIVAGTQAENILADGVIVIPIPEAYRDEDGTVKADSTITGTIENLPYGTYDSDTGTWNRYRYQVQRSKANGVWHDKQGEAYHVVINQTSTMVEQYKNTNVTVKRTWDSSAEGNTLRPSTIKYKLYRNTEDENTTTEEEVKNVSEIPVDGYITASISENNYQRTFENLPNGKIVQDAKGNYVWKKYTYFVKEYDSNGNEISSVSPYSNEQTKGIEKPFVLKKVSRIYTEAELNEGIKNTLVDTDFSVTKVWDDTDDEYGTRADIYLKLERRPANSQTWVQVPTDDMSSVSVQRSFAVGIDESVEFGTASSYTITENPFQLPKPDDEKIGRIKLDLSGLPKYSEDGILYKYRVVETQVGTTQVEENRVYLFIIPKPSTGTWETSYATKQHRGVKNYLVDYENTDGSTKVTNKVVTNSVTYVHVKAEKIWDDEKNIYGKRPKTIKYKLSRKTATINIDPDNSENVWYTDEQQDTDFGSIKEVGEAVNWTVVWSNLAAHNDEGKEYIYEVEELNVPYYQTPPEKAESFLLENNDVTKIHTFTNKYVPEKKSLTATKEWDDMKNKYQLRPDSILFELRCRYDKYKYLLTGDVDAIPDGTYDGPVLGSAVYASFTDTQKSAFDSADGKFKLTKDGYTNGNTVDTTGAKDKWQISFSDLPAYINTAGTAVKNGKSVPVTYYIREYLPSTNGSGYVYTDYKEYYQLSNYPYKPSDDINADKTKSHVIPVMIDNLPKTDDAAQNPKDYDYKLYSVVDNTETEITQIDIQTFVDTVTIYANVSTAAGADKTVLKVKRRPKGSENGVEWEVVKTAKASAALKAVVGYTMRVDGDSDNDSTVKPVEITGNAQSGEITISNTNSVENSPTSRGVFLLNHTDTTNVPPINNPTPPELIISNTLNTRDITVALDWQDNGYMSGKIFDSGDHYGENKVNGLHYNTEITLSCDSLEVDTSHNKYTETKTISVLNKTETDGKRTYVTCYGVKFKNLPKYNAKGETYEYKVGQKIGSESLTADQYNEQEVNAYSDIITNSTGDNATAKILTNDVRHLGSDISESKTDAETLLTVASNGRKYNYASTYTSYTDNVTGADYVTQYNILNTLPLTAVTVVKEWDDQNDAFNLRPTTDIGIKLERSKSGVSGTTTSAYNENMEFEDVPYSTHDTNTAEEANKYPVKTTVENGKDTWEYTYYGILKCDDKNKPYIFKVTETFTGEGVTHINGYKAPKYVRSEENNTNGRIVDDVNDSSYTDTGDKWDGTHPLAEKFYIQNELDTRNVYVAKSWNDNDYGNSLTSEQKTALLNNLHYNVLVTLTSNQFSTNTARKLSSGTYSSYKYGEQHIIPKGETHAVKFENLPKYDSTGTEIVYKVWETYTDTTESTSAVNNSITYSNTGTDVTNTPVSETDSNKKYFEVEDKRYGYEGSCKLVTHNATQTETEDYLQYNVLNTLPLTAVQAVKTWDDQSNKYGLRPENITLELKTKAVAESNLNNTAVTGPNVDTWSDPAYKVEQTVKKSGTNEWVFEYRKLLKYDAGNNPYIFRIEEKFADSETHLKAYKEPVYTKQVVTAVKVNNSEENATTQLAWDGTHPLVEKLEVKNELDTRDIIVTKSWDDNDYGSMLSDTDRADLLKSLHYNVEVTLQSTGFKVDNEIYTASKIINSENYSGHGVTFSNLPIYDKNGAVIAYTLAEDVAADNATTTGSESKTKTTEGTLITDNNEFTVTDKRYGYVGTCKKIVNSTGGYVEQYNITNTLPVSIFTVNKTWDDDKNRDGYRPATLGFTLIRSNDNDFSVSGTASPDNWTTTFNDGIFLTYPKTGDPYTYTITEDNFTYKDKYTESHTVGDSSTDANYITTRTDSFTNKHTSQKRDLTLEKKWVDTVKTTINGVEKYVDYSQWTRPSDIKVRLKFSYNNSTAKYYSQLTDKEKEALNLKSEYQGDISIDQNKTIDRGKTWMEVLTELPEKINPTGTATTNGASYPVEYSIEEYTHGGYNEDYSSAVTLDADGKKLTVTNTLKTEDIKVYKEWSDKKLSDSTQDYDGTDYSHFSITGKITSSDIPSSDLNNKEFTISVPENDRGSKTESYAEIKGVPIYKNKSSDNTAEQAHYTIEELNTIGGNTNMKYGYEVQTGKIENFVLDTNGTTVKTFTFSNKLPLTVVNVEKIWDDDFGGIQNAYSLRPSSITLKLYRTTTSSLDRNAQSGWEHVKDYMLSGEGNVEKWSYTFTDLLQYDDQSQPYYFKVEESEVKAYSTSYTESSATSPASGLSLTNTLITRDITVEKEWDDSSYLNGTSLHYDIDFTLTREADTGEHIYVPQTLTYNGTLTSDKTNSTETITIPDVPVYDKNGGVIEYTATESRGQYGYELVTGYPQTQNGTGDLSEVVTKYTFKNKLPVTYLKVKKTWNVDTTYHGYAKGAITVDISRSTTNGTTVTPDGTFNNSYKNKSISYKDSDMGEKYGPLLVKDEGNNVFTYKVQEHTVQGYETSYKVGSTDTNEVTAAESTDAAPQQVDITNTQITDKVKIQKIDYSYYESHKGEGGYKDKLINGAVFKLYIKDSTNNKTPVYVKLHDGYYVFDTSSSNNTVTSQTVGGVDGIIEIHGLPLNTYYLEEQDGISTAYKKNTAEFSFVLNVDSSNRPVNTYTAVTPTTSNGYTQIYGKNGFITHSGELPKIGNEETPRTLSLTKQDATNGRGLEKATYYLLYMIPHEIGSNTTQSQLDTYKQNAKNAIINSGGQFTQTVAQYWRIIDKVQTGSTGVWSTPTTGLMHGIYTLMEVQAPVGYNIANDGFDTITYEKYNPDTGVSTPSVSETTEMTLIYLDDTHISCDIIHKDPRRDAKVKIYKQDEYENPLNGAEFELWYSSQPLHTSSEKSDFDYIFFTDNDVYNERQVGNVWGNVVADFYDGSDNLINPSVNLTTYWINDNFNYNSSEYQKVYKVKPPENAVKVVFRNSDSTKQTDKISFKRGYGYYKTDIENSKYTVNGNDWNYAQTSDSSQTATKQYQTTGEYIRIKNDNIGNDKDWDDLHIWFSDDNGYILGQSPNGYTPELQTVGSDSYYQIKIPAGATKFSINNGSKKPTTEGGTHYHSISDIWIKPYAGYKLVQSGSDYVMKIYAKELNGTPSTVDENPQAYTWETPVRVANLVTGYDGLPETVTIAEGQNANAAIANDADGVSVEVKNWGWYFFKEKTKPTGYTAAENVLSPFEIGANEADKVVNVYKADNARIKGKVTLTKTAQEKVGNINIGQGVPNATFKLYKSNGEEVKISVDTASNSVYNVDSKSSQTEMVTDSDGKLYINELDWGQYYLQEVSAPTGFKVNSTPVYFTVGRNNCGDTPQQLTIKDPAAKAKIKLTKTINDRVEAWGDPTFIFKIRQTASYGTSDPAATDPTAIAEAEQPVKIISLTLTSSDEDGGKKKSTDYFDVDPGTYEITEVSVARYEFDSAGSSLSYESDKVKDASFTDGKAKFTIKADGQMTVNFDNHVEYYDKFSHVNCEVNKFHGYKGIRVEYNEAIPVGTNQATINKTALDVYKIMSNGKEVKLDPDNTDDAAFMNGITYTYVEKSGDDSRFGKDTTHDFLDDTTNHQIKITNPSRYTDSVYTLKAKDTNNFECKFDISFVSKNQQTKAYEKTVVFKADIANKSYFLDEGVRTSQYALTFTMVKNDSNQYEVYCVKHNGKVIAQGSSFATQVNNAISALTTKVGDKDPVLTVNEAYRSSDEFDKWNDGTNDYSTLYYSTFSSDVTDYSKRNETITYTAKLKTKS